MDLLVSTIIKLFTPLQALENLLLPQHLMKLFSMLSSVAAVVVTMMEAAAVALVLG